MSRDKLNFANLNPSNLRFILLFHGYYRLNDHPLIISTWDNEALQHLAQFPRTHPVYCLIHLPWNHAVAHRMLRKLVLLYTLRKRGLRPILVTNSPEEESYRKRLGITGFQCISYVYTDEKEYCILAGVEKQYDAVYTAQLQKFKRIALAANIEKLFILTYTPGQRKNNLPAFCPEVSHAAYNPSWLSFPEKNLIYNQSRVGLCLSAEEGPMLASLEYQLVGMPVVSTPGLGGRQEYYHPDSCLIVKPYKEAVQAGVREMISRQIDAHATRQRTIGRLEADRSRYVDFICTYVRKDSGITVEPKVLYHTIFSDPKANFIPLTTQSNPQK